jgi:hypothetical protein
MMARGTEEPEPGALVLALWSSNLINYYVLGFKQVASE